MAIRTPPSVTIGGYSLIVTTSPLKKLAPNLLRVDANNKSADSLWLMMFNGSSVPADGTVPIAEAVIVQGLFTNTVSFIPTGFPMPIANSTGAGPTGLVLVYSSTSGTLTAATTAASDITAYIEEYEARNNIGFTVTGDLTTYAKAFQIWSEAAGAASAKQLKVARITNRAVTVKYAVLYAVDAPLTTSKIIMWVAIPANDGTNDGAYLLDFGKSGGLSPVEQIAASGLFKKGCTIWEQDSPATPGVQSATSDLVCQTEYSSY